MSNIVQGIDKSRWTTFNNSPELIFFINAPKLILFLNEEYTPISKPIDFDSNSGRPLMPSPFGENPLGIKNKLTLIIKELITNM